MSIVLTIYSVEEHVGKTTIAINLGASLIHETQSSVLLVDFNAAGNGAPAHAMLKLFPVNPLRDGATPRDQLQQYLQLHSSQLFLLTIDAALLQEEFAVREFLRRLFEDLRAAFDYILVDTPGQANRLTHEMLDCSESILFISAALDHEYPLGVLGTHELRQVVNLQAESAGRGLLQQPRCYVLPQDPVAVETFRGSGIPFVIQLPYRPISQMIARLARDLGRKQVGLALTGGGALGLAQLGVLEVFERNRIAVDFFAGTSFGALIGAAGAAGVELTRFTRYVVSWALSRSYLSRLNARFFEGRLLKEKSLHALCDAFLKDVYFEELLIPLNVMAFDIRTGRSVIFQEGKVLDAVKSSMRIPGIFAPFRQTEQYLVDSSVFYATPIAPLKQMGAHITIAVQVAPAPGVKKRLTPKQLLAEQNYAITAATFDGLMAHMNEMSDDAAQPAKLQPDVVILPEVGGIAWQEFHRINELIDAGIQAAEKAIPKIEELKWGKNH